MEPVHPGMVACYGEPVALALPGPGYSTHSWEMKGSPVAGWCHSSCLARPSSGQILTSLILAAAVRPLPTLGSWLRLAWNISLFRSCPLGHPSVTVMSGGRASRARVSMLTQDWTSSRLWLGSGLPLLTGGRMMVSFLFAGHPDPL